MLNARPFSRIFKFSSPFLPFFLGLFFTRWKFPFSKEKKCKVNLRSNCQSKSWRLVFQWIWFILLARRVLQSWICIMRQASANSKSRILERVCFPVKNPQDVISFPNKLHRGIPSSRTNYDPAVVVVVKHSTVPLRIMATSWSGLVGSSTKTIWWKSVAPWDVIPVIRTPGTELNVNWVTENGVRLKMSMTASPGPKDSRSRLKILTAVK